MLLKGSICIDQPLQDPAMLRALVREALLNALPNGSASPARHTPLQHICYVVCVQT